MRMTESVGEKCFEYLINEILEKCKAEISTSEPVGSACVECAVLREKLLKAREHIEECEDLISHRAKLRKIFGVKIGFGR